MTDTNNFDRDADVGRSIENNLVKKLGGVQTIAKAFVSESGTTAMVHTRGGTRVEVVKSKKKKADAEWWYDFRPLNAGLTPDINGFGVPTNGGDGAKVRRHGLTKSDSGYSLPVVKSAYQSNDIDDLRTETETDDVPIRGGGLWYNDTDRVTWTVGALEEVISDGVTHSLVPCDIGEVQYTDGDDKLVRLTVFGLTSATPLAGSKAILSACIVRVEAAAFLRVAYREGYTIRVTDYLNGAPQGSASWLAKDAYVSGIQIDGCGFNRRCCDFSADGASLVLDVYIDTHNTHTFDNYVAVLTLGSPGSLTMSQTLRAIPVPTIEPSSEPGPGGTSSAYETSTSPSESGGCSQVITEHWWGERYVENHGNPVGETFTGFQMLGSPGLASTQRTACQFLCAGFAKDGSIVGAVVTSDQNGFADASEGAYTAEGSHSYTLGGSCTDVFKESQTAFGPSGTSTKEYSGMVTGVSTSNKSGTTMVTTGASETSGKTYLFSGTGCSLVGTTFDKTSFRSFSSQNQESSFNISYTYYDLDPVTPGLGGTSSPSSSSSSNAYSSDVYSSDGTGVAFYLVGFDPKSTTIMLGKVTGTATYSSTSISIDNQLQPTNSSSGGEVTSRELVIFKNNVAFATKALDVNNEMRFEGFWEESLFSALILGLPNHTDKLVPGVGFFFEKQNWSTVSSSEPSGPPNEYLAPSIMYSPAIKK